MHILESAADLASAPLRRWIRAAHTLNRLHVEGLSHDRAIRLALQTRSEASLEWDPYWTLLPKIALAEEAERSAYEALPTFWIWPYRQVLNRFQPAIEQQSSQLAEGRHHFWTSHGLLLFQMLAVPLSEDSGRAADRTIRMLGLGPAAVLRFMKGSHCDSESAKSALLEALWQSVQDPKPKLANLMDARSPAFVSRPIAQRAADIAKSLTGPPIGLTARGGSSKDRDNVDVADLDSGPTRPDDQPGALELLMQRERDEEIQVALAQLSLNPKQEMLLGELLWGIPPAEALKRLGFPWTVYTSLCQKAQRNLPELRHLLEPT